MGKELLKPTEYKPYLGSEDNFQMAVARYLDLLGVLWCHVANERKTDIKTNKKGQTFSLSGKKLKDKGQKKGVPDCLIFEARKGYAGFAIELKVGKNKPSEDQIFWLNALRARNWKVLVTKSLDEFIAEVDNYFAK